MKWHALILAICFHGSAWADAPVDVDTEEPSRFFGSSTLSTAFQGGLRNPGTQVHTATGTLAFGARYNPSLTVALALRGGIRLNDSLSLSMAWSVARDWAPCDTCTDGFDPGTGGMPGSVPVRTSDLALTLQHRGLILIKSADLRLAGALTVTAPASRDSLTCNPMYGAVNGTVRVSGQLQGIGWGAHHSLGRAMYQHAHAPVGDCAPPLQDTETVDTITGSAAPTPWDGQRFTGGMGNPAWTQTTGITLQNLQAPLTQRLRGKAGQWVHKNLSTTASLGLVGLQSRRDAATAVDTDTASVQIEAAKNPWVWMWTGSIGAGAQLHPKHRVDLTVSNQVPRLLTDPGATFSTLPARSAVRLGWTASF